MYSGERGREGERGCTKEDEWMDDEELRMAGYNHTLPLLRPPIPAIRPISLRRATDSTCHISIAPLIYSLGMHSDEAVCLSVCLSAA